MIEIAKERQKYFLNLPWAVYVFSEVKTLHVAL